MRDVAAVAGLVSRSAVWLRLVVAVCYLALVGSVLQVLRDNVDHETVLTAAGVVAVVVAAYALSRRPATERRSRRRGAHAA